MGRKVATITIEGDPSTNRDANKQFRITEMSADRAERWFTRLVFALANAGLKVPDDALFAGTAGFRATVPIMLVQGLRSLAGMDYETAEPLLNEMLGCVAVRAPGTETYFELTGAGMTQVEEVSTLLKLRLEVVQVHVSFSLADALSKLKGPAAAPEASA